MKKLHLLSGMIVFAVVASINADVAYVGGISGKEAQKIEDVQRGKLARQQELARPAVYKMMDALVVDKAAIDWAVVFSMLDSMKGVINVNEYRTPAGDTLPVLAARENNSYAMQTLMSKYGAKSSKLRF